ncbi:aspartate--tRNA ligase, mitochondrial [Diabrotica virgifera virgifera]|uniref:Aminoacyl-transfer RNA synthetases class-II family profile domain-containing protein n=1 Tax=Diabrotica virgifera virgifera TaxID=50390 RepID=A0ABM5L890_DIAVI|nr:aspartate--tRNA ligase, mitochondrial [Diabrotica virgifera virgifera]
MNYFNKISSTPIIRVITVLKDFNSKQLLNCSRRSLRNYSTKTKSTTSYVECDIREPVNFTNKYTHRTYTCGELRSANIGEHIVLCGWLEYQRMNKFVILRDSYGQIQLLINDEDTETQKLLENIPLESVLKIEGTVMARPINMINKNQPTGEIEVLINRFKVLNKAKENLPFNIREFQKAKEPLRMQYRYLDLRFSQMQRNLRFRSNLFMKMREFLCNNNFVDVETPTLFKATPGGAQEFIVPTRFPGQFYSLVQSPQQFKQMLMAGAIDRYFQIARCYRDEGARSDRQPEFTQLDIEMSFTSDEGVIRLIEELLQYCLSKELDIGDEGFKRISYNEAMEKYGSDKPDVSFDFELNNCTDILKENSSLATDKNFGAYFICFPEQFAVLNNKVKELTQNIANKFHQVKFIQNVIKNKQDWINKVGRLLSNSKAQELLEKGGIFEKSVLFLAYGDKNETLNLLGKIRTEYADYLESIGMTVRRKGLHFLWVVDFPLFEISEEGTLKSAHHPFTAPHPDDLSLLKSDPLKVRAIAYDLVLNGNEVAGGSIRIHDPNLQKTILNLLKISPDTMQHMLDMLESGCPPHGGIAFGLDRLVSILLGTTSIRDVIAFPKNYEGRDPMSGAPSYISDEDKKLYHIKSVDEDKNR